MLLCNFQAVDSGQVTFLLCKMGIIIAPIKKNIAPIVQMKWTDTYKQLYFFFLPSFNNFIEIIIQFSSVTQSCPALWDHMNCSTPGLPVHHQLPESTQTHVHWVGDAIQPSHPLSSPSPALNLSQHQGLFQWVSSSHQVAKVLESQLQHESFQWTPRTDLL